MSKSSVKLVVFCFVIVVFGIIIASNIHTVPTGYTGVMIRLGKVSDKPIEGGKIIFTQPFVEDLVTINNKLQDFVIKTKIWGETNDRTPVYAEGIYVTIQISPEKSVWLYSNVSNLASGLLTETLVASAAKAAMVELSPTDVTNRAKIEPLVREKLSQSLDEKYGEGAVFVSMVSISNMDFESEYNKAIQAKSIATQNEARSEMENRTAITKAESDKQVALLKAESEKQVALLKAETEKEVAMYQAQAEAEKVRIIAEAEADANKMIEETLSNPLMELKKIESWDGKLPLITGGNDIMFDITSLLETEK